MTAVKDYDPDVFDFKDGCGCVPAHRHGNGGGWVADTAHVDDMVYVGFDASVSGISCVQGYVRIMDSASVAGRSTVRGRVLILDRARVEGHACVEDGVVLRGDVLVGAASRLSGHIELGGYQTLMDFKNCTACPVLFGEIYGSLRENNCMNCLNTAQKREQESTFYNVRGKRPHTAPFGESLLLPAFFAGSRGHVRRKESFQTV